jgi:tryptophanase
MFNPLVDSFESLTDAEVENSLRTLSQRYFQTRNPQLQEQISVMVEMYREEMRARNAKAQFQKNAENGETGLDKLINVS